MAGDGTMKTPVIGEYCSNYHTTIYSGWANCVSSWNFCYENILIRGCCDPTGVFCCPWNTGSNCVITTVSPLPPPPICSFLCAEGCSDVSPCTNGANGVFISSGLPGNSTSCDISCNIGYFKSGTSCAPCTNGANGVLTGRGISGIPDSCPVICNNGFKSLGTVCTFGFSGGFALITEVTGKIVRKVNLETNAVTTIGSKATGGIAGITSSCDGRFALYTDIDSHIIVKLNISSGVANIIAGLSQTSGTSNGYGSSARFNRPAQIKMSKNCANVFIADSNNHAIRKIDLNTLGVTRIAGTLTAGNTDGDVNVASLNTPMGIVISPDETFILVTEGNRVRKISLTGTLLVSTVAGDSSTLGGVAGSTNGPGGQARFNAPQEIDISSDGTFAVVADFTNKMVRKIDLATNVVSTICTSSDNIKGVSILPFDQNVLFTGQSTNKVYSVSVLMGNVSAVTGNGLSQTSDGTGTSTASFNSPSGTAIWKCISPGNGYTSYDTCSACGVGFYGSGNGACLPCNKGFYTNTGGSSECTPCAIGSYIGSAGSTSCTSCALGTYASGTGYSSCKPCSTCVDRQYTMFSCNATSDTICGCPQGYQVSNGSTCIVCADGKSTSAPGLESCVDCTAGTYRARLPYVVPTCVNTLNTGTCNGCMSTPWSNTPCSDCISTCPSRTITSPNPYSNYQNQHLVIAPLYATQISVQILYVETEGSYDFFNLYWCTSLSNAKTGTLCTSVLRFSGSMGQITYVLPSGYGLIVFTSDSSVTKTGWSLSYTSVLNIPLQDMPECRACPMQTYNSVSGATACLNCVPPLFTLTTGMTACLGGPCVAGTYSATGEDFPSACIQCPEGTSSASGASTCWAPITGSVSCGLYVNGGVAVLCPPDHFCPS